MKCRLPAFVNTLSQNQIYDIHTPLQVVQYVRRKQNESDIAFPLITRCCLDYDFFMHGHTLARGALDMK